MTQQQQQQDQQQAPQEQPPPATELLTQLQDQLHTVSKMFFDFVGILQRDAPPLPVAGEELVPPPPAAGSGAAASAAAAPAAAAFDVERTTSLMAAQLVEQFKATDALIRALPPGAEAAAGQLDRIRSLQEEHARAGADLDAAAEEAEAQLGELQRLFAVLAAQRLADAAAGLAPLPLPPLEDDG